jgi:hypothetical protein
VSRGTLRERGAPSSFPGWLQMTPMQREGPVAAVGRIHAARHQAAAGPYSHRHVERPLSEAQRSWATGETARGADDRFRKARTGTTDPLRKSRSRISTPESGRPASA